ncbi:SMI1/KNR4 family protein [Amylibacter sp. SFDW26]|uniref:SMI1/KNR4 family protein n=1 Tax=Amylibacter sp. SFDW26 TaxID=2652722 RepID=UPI001261AD5F|nr:SMI1/KNR4 family protein [Amylibacter sp. SFDW26]KAB7615542.1 SMI1/KNR4 family protein [Amylibacter sp. SFDW26]
MPFEVSEEYIIAAESGLGVRLPDSYRELMQKANGGECNVASDLWSLSPILDKSNRKRLARTCNDIVRETKAMSSWVGWPSGAICIAQNGTGDALIFLTEETVCPSTIYLWNHETGNTKIVAQDFSLLKRT